MDGNKSQKYQLIQLPGEANIYLACPLEIICAQNVKTIANPTSLLFDEISDLEKHYQFKP